jgi:hypothetical protein
MDEWFEAKIRGELRVLISKIENTINLDKVDSAEAKEEAISDISSRIMDKVELEIKNVKRDMLIQGIMWGWLTAVAISIWIYATR